MGVYTGPQPPKPLQEMTQEEQAEEGARQMIGFMNSCPGKTVMAGVSGFALGGFSDYLWHLWLMIHLLELML